MSPKWKYFYPGYLWALPGTLIGLLLAIVYRAHSFRWNDGCLEAIGGEDSHGDTLIWGTPSAQTHGFLIFYSDELARDFAPLRVHERCHVVQGFVLGPLFLLAYPLLHVWFWIATGSFWEGYRKNPFEGQAYDRQWSKTAWGSKTEVVQERLYRV